MIFMKWWFSASWLGFSMMLLCPGRAQSQTEAGGPGVILEKTPDGGLQPQALLDAAGTLHLLYFKGNPREGDLVYVRRVKGEKTFSAPLRVNSEPGSAVAAGTIRGGQLALGKKGRVHVAWNGSMKTKTSTGHPMLVTRLNDAGTAFEPQRNLMQTTTDLDGGGSLTADAGGRVQVFWHARKTDGPAGEETRMVWLATSEDEGRTFSPERAISVPGTGTCGCCGMRAFADSLGNSNVLYRGAQGGTQRDMYLLASPAGSKDYQSQKIHAWAINACPMSSYAFAEGAGDLLAAWETSKQIHFAAVKKGSVELGPMEGPKAAPGSKHPAVAINSQGKRIVAWTEGTGWMKGGGLAWQVYSSAGNAEGAVGRRPGAIPVWGLVSVVTEPDGTFRIFY